MAKYDVTHACGHTITHQIYGSNAKGQRDSRVEWLAAQPCRECERAAAAEATSDLPALTGSEKQITWATTIRADKMRELGELIGQMRAQVGDAPAKVALIDQVTAHIDAQDAAGWWIDRRDQAARTILRDAIAALGLKQG